MTNSLEDLTPGCRNETIANASNVHQIFFPLVNTNDERIEAVRTRKYPPMTNSWPDLRGTGLRYDFETHPLVYVINEPHNGVQPRVGFAYALNESSCPTSTWKNLVGERF